MIKLIESGLFGDRLVPIDSAFMVDRYNACLTQIGLSPTKLTSFHIDGWGWSPEIAEEQNNRFYLSHGMANPYGIIISPEQANASMYFPYHSFDWDVHKLIFSTYVAQINDITAQCGIWFEMEQQISAYRVPQDLLMVDVFTLNFSTADNLIVAARIQRELISKFNDSEHSWANEDLRNAIIESAKNHGDLRFRSIDLAPLPFRSINSFYTLAFNGMYVFRNLPNGKPLLVYGNNSSKISGELSHDVVEFNLNHPGLIDYFYGQKMLSDDVAYFKDRSFLIEIHMEHMIVSAAERINLTLPPGVNEQTRKNILLDGLIRANALDDLYFELEKLLVNLSHGRSNANNISEAARKVLLHPAEYLPENDKIVMWHLLSNQGNSPVMMYLFDKARFFNAYSTWNETMQQWSVSQILKNRFIFQEIIK